MGREIGRSSIGRLGSASFLLVAIILLTLVMPQFGSGKSIPGAKMLKLSGLGTSSQTRCGNPGGVQVADSRTGALLVYSTYRNCNNSKGGRLMALRLDPRGKKLGSPVSLSTPAKPAKWKNFGAVAIAWNPVDRSWFLAWEEFEPRSGQVNFRTMDADGSLGPFLDSSYPDSSVNFEAECLATGTCLVAWEAMNGSGRIRARTLEGGDELSREFNLVSSGSSDFPYFANGFSLESRPDGQGFLLGYTVRHPRGTQSRIAMVRTLNAEGESPGVQRRISPAPSSSRKSRTYSLRASAPSFCRTQSGEFVAIYSRESGSWSDGSSLDSTGVGVRRVSASGVPQGGVRGSVLGANERKSGHVSYNLEGSQCALSFVKRSGANNKGTYRESYFVRSLNSNSRLGKKRSMLTLKQPPSSIYWNPESGATLDGKVFSLFSFGRTNMKTLASTETATFMQVLK